jgi:adenine phosphoribosyltransferase
MTELTDAADLADVVAGRLRDVPDFPKPGIVFKDIVPLLADGPVFAACVAGLAELARGTGPVDIVGGIEARGFILAAAVARELGCGLVPIRKAGKLPPPTLRRSYALEYGIAEIEVPQDLITGLRVYVVDDVLATGGTLAAARDLIADAGGVLTGVGVLLELTFLDGRARLPGLDVAAILSA